MNHLLTIIFLCTTFLLSAQSNADLDLGNVLIQGESTILADSVSYRRDFAFYNTVNSKADLNFIPQFQPSSLPSQVPETGSKLVFQVLSGNSNTRLNAAYSQNEILSFSSEYDLHNIKEKWFVQNIAVNWQPQSQGYEWVVAFSDLTCGDSIDQTKNTSYNFSISTPSYSNEKVVPFEFDLDLSLQYLTSDQNGVNENDLNLSIDFAAHSADFNSHLIAEYLNQAFSGFSNFGLNEKIFGNPKIWVGYDELHLYPSVSFDRSFKIASEIEFQLANLPSISTYDRKKDFYDNFFQLLKNNSLQEKKQFNAYFAFKNYNMLPFSIYYNPQLIRDKRMYEESASGYYKRIAKDRFINIFGADLFWKYKGFEVKHSARYLNCEKEIYFDAKLRLDNSVSKQYGSLLGNIEMNLLADRIDDEGTEMDDFFQINLNLEYEFKPNFEIFGYVENLLNTDYAKYSNIPEEGINLYVGCRFGF